jgi:hypothetical protein
MVFMPVISELKTPTASKKKHFSPHTIAPENKTKTLKTNETE